LQNHVALTAFVRFPQRSAPTPRTDQTTSLIPWAKPNFWGNEHQYVSDALTFSWISGGPFVERLERDFASYCGIRHALSVANGTAALHPAYLADRIGRARRQLSHALEECYTNANSGVI